MLNNNFSVDKQVLNRICEEILPRINNKINKLTVDRHSMERILRAVDYPQLYSLSFVNFQPDTLLQHLTGILFITFTYLINKTFLYIKGDTKFHRLLTDQITHLNIDIHDEITTELSDENESNLFALILSIGKRLTDLTFSQWFCHKNS